MTPEEKKKAFNDNPDDFINVNDIIICSMKDPEGKLGIMLGNSTASELKLSWANINMAITETLMMMRAKTLAQAKVDANRVIKPNQIRKSQPGAFGRNN